MASNVSWAALSYCWGGDSQFTLRSDTFQDLKAGIPLAKWPATLRDAIKITQYLGLQYVWIDALCIFQDSASDWRAEATLMRNVYPGAIITIIASESPSTNAGIYAPRLLGSRSACTLAFDRVTENHSEVWLRPSFRSSVHVLYSDSRMDFAGRSSGTLDVILSQRSNDVGMQQLPLDRKRPYHIAGSHV